MRNAQRPLGWAIFFLLWLCGVSQTTMNRTECVGNGLKWCGDFVYASGCQPQCFFGNTSTHPTLAEALGTVDIISSGDWTLFQTPGEQSPVTTFAATSNSFLNRLLTVTPASPYVKSGLLDRIFYFASVDAYQSPSFSWQVPQGTSTVVRLPVGIETLRAIFLADSSLADSSVTKAQLVNRILEATNDNPIWSMDNPSFREPVVTDFFSTTFTPCPTYTATANPCPSDTDATFVWWSTFLNDNQQLAFSPSDQSRSTLSTIFPTFNLRNPVLTNGKMVTDSVHPAEFRHFYFDLPSNIPVGRLLIKVETNDLTCPHMNTDYEQPQACPFGVLLVRRAVKPVSLTQCPDHSLFEWRQTFTGLALLSLSSSVEITPKTRYFISVYSDIFKARFTPDTKVLNFERANTLEGDSIGCVYEPWQFNITVTIDQHDDLLSLSFLFLIIMFASPLTIITVLCSRSRRKNFITLEKLTNHPWLGKCFKLNFRFYKYLAAPNLTAQQLTAKARRGTWSTTAMSLVTIAIFAWVPGFQYSMDTMLDDQSVKCHFNTLCSRDIKIFGWIQLENFNSIMSNLGYVFCGIFYILWVRMNQYGDNLANKNGVSLYYLMGVAIIAEGVFSGVYHTCPTLSGFQFDTIFVFFFCGCALFALLSRRRVAFLPNHFFAGFDLVVVANMVGVYASMNGPSYEMWFWVVICPIWIWMVLVVCIWLYTGRGIFCCRTVNQGKRNQYVACWGLFESASHEIDVERGPLKLFAVLLAFVMNTVLIIALGAYQRRISSDVFLVIMGVNWFIYLLYYATRKLFPTTREKNYMTTHRYASARALDCAREDSESSCRNDSRTADRAERKENSRTIETSVHSSVDHYGYRRGRNKENSRSVYDGSRKPNRSSLRPNMGLRTASPKPSNRDSMLELESRPNNGKPSLTINTNTDLEYGGSSHHHNSNIIINNSSPTAKKVVVVEKPLHIETIYWYVYLLVFFFLVLTAIALYLLSIEVTDKNVPVHLSRLHNQNCVFLLFDWHDLWHLVCAHGLLLMSLICYHIDDDIHETDFIRIF